MKRFLMPALLMLLFLLPAYGLAEELPEQLVMAPGESRAFTLPFAGYWDSDAPEVAEGEGDAIIAHEEGYAILALVSPEGDEWVVEVEVIAREDEVPAAIREAVRIGIAEWEETGEKRLPQEPKSNKYTKWWGYACGWCGAFASYCLDSAGIPLEPTDTYRKVKPTGDGSPHGIREAAVPKLYTGFENMERLTDIPRPGYLVIYGARDYYAFVHVGLITDVIDRGDGVYQLFTVEGNMGSTVKRYSYLYDSTAKHERNLSLLPESEWEEPGVYHYDEPRQTKSDGKTYGWYVNVFCQTWQ